LGFLTFWIGVKADNSYIGYFSVHVVLAGLIVWLFGLALFKELIFPWFFMLFMWPLSFMDNLVAFPLRLLMSNLAYHVLNFLGAHCTQVGTAVVSAPDYVHGIKQGEKFGVDVADPCSGIRSLFALTMFSALYAYFILQKTWQKWVLFACSPALAIFGNLTRIVMLSLGSLYFGSQFAIGTNDEPSWFHEAAGFAVFFVAVGGMIGIGWILERDWSFILHRRKN
jgi:exosortase